MVNLEKKKWYHILIFLNVGVFLILINILGDTKFYRWDLTEENRFSISTATKEMLNNLTDQVYIEVYLEGDLPSGFDRMKKSIKEVLDEFNVYSSRPVNYRFINPDQAQNVGARDAYFQSLIDRGIQPVDVFHTKNGNRIQKRIFPGALVFMGVGETGVSLFKGNEAASPEERLNQAIEGIEYELASSINKLGAIRLKKVGIVKGHGELEEAQIISFKQTLQDQYAVESIDLNDQSELNRIDVMMILKPEFGYTEVEKYNLDQYIMNGGSALFLIDMLKVNEDSIGSGTLAYPSKQNLSDLLFRYGVRLNQNYIQDIVAGVQPVVVGKTGDRSQVTVLPWLYFPIVNNFSQHIITRNINAVRTEYVGSIDTVMAVGITKTPLLFSSQFSRVVTAPALVSIEQMRLNPDPDKLNTKNIPLAYLLEGKFTSLYKNRFPPAGIDRSKFLEAGTFSKIVVVADGDIVKNQLAENSGRPLPLGFDQYSGKSFGNLDFLLNTIAYLTEGEGLITARAKEIKIRPLNKIKVEEERTKWQIINLVFPILLLFIYGIGRYILRKRKYSKF